jgi:hypothetical protein
MMRRAVRFWGHDGAMEMEMSFFVAADLLKTASAEHAVQRNQLVGGFDLNRALLEAAAIEIYARGLKGSYDLLIVDF